MLTSGELLTMLTKRNGLQKKQVGLINDVPGKSQWPSLYPNSRITSAFMTISIALQKTVYYFSTIRKPGAILRNSPSD